MTRLLVALSLLVPALLTSSPARAQSESVSAEDRYELCLKYKDRRNWTKALEQCQKTRNLHRDDPVSVLAELAIAEIHFDKGDYEQARVYYEDFARLHPRHPKLDLVVFRTGLAIYKRAPKAAGRDQSATWQAVNHWLDFENRFPDSEYIPQVEKYRTSARERLARKELNVARFYAKRDAWGATLGRVQRLVARYPEASSVPEALVLGAQAAHTWGMVDEALALRERLAAHTPDAPELEEIDRILERTPGEPPEQELFKRPYRLGGGGGGAPTGGMGGQM